MLKDLRETILVVNKKDHLDLAKEFGFDHSSQQYIYRVFWPIIEIQSHSKSKVLEILKDLKNEFVNNNKVFDLEIFQRNNLDLLQWELREYLDCFKRGKYVIWEYLKGKYFYRLKLDSERNTPNNQTLLISDKSEIQLEIYFKMILEIISNFSDYDNSKTLEKSTDGQTEIIKFEEKHEAVRKELIQYKFDELPKVVAVDLNSLLRHIFTNDLPYQIAYLDYLGFLKFLNENYCKTNGEHQKLVANIIGHPNTRAVRGNINGLRSEKSSDRKRYTAHLHTENIAKHYQTLK